MLFPALWTTYLAVVSNYSPFGRLGMWSPTLGGEAYRWLVPYTGAVGQDWIVATFAVLLAQVVQFAGWITIEYTDSTFHEFHRAENGSNMHTQNHLDDVDVSMPVENIPSDTLISHETAIENENTSKRKISSPRPRYHSAIALTALLAILAIPSYSVLPGTPGSSLPHSSTSSNATTDVSLACILPLPPNPRSTNPKASFDAYLSESRTINGKARIHLWPEGAISFENKKERKDRLAEVQQVAKDHGIWIGVAFLEPASEDGNGNPSNGKKQNGMALVGPDGIDMEYYKNHLVPGE